MAERGGNVRVGPVPDDTKFTLEPILLENVVPGTVVDTDGHLSYGDLGLSFQHTAINHGRWRIRAGYPPHEHD